MRLCDDGKDATRPPPDFKVVRLFLSLRVRRRVELGRRIEFMGRNWTIIFGNYTKKHAECIIKKKKNFLISANKTVEILSGDFSQSFYSETLGDEIDAAVSRGVDIRVVSLGGIVSRWKTTTAPFCSLSSHDKKGSMEIRYGRLLDGAITSHFMVVDGKRYRVEAPHRIPLGNDDMEVHAEVCCNGIEKAVQLIAAFDGVWVKLGSRKQ